LLVELDALGPLQVYDGTRWFNYQSSELKFESLTFLLTSKGDYVRHRAITIGDIKGFRAFGEDTREKLKPILIELKELI
jgi:hypothetical protein